VASLRHRVGALFFDWPRLVPRLVKRSGWVGYANRREQLTTDRTTGGARCEWRFTSDIHVAAVYRSAARLLMQRALAEFPIHFARDLRITGEPLVSFVIGHRGNQRLPLLLKTLETIAAQDLAVECIVVEQSAEAILPPVLPKWVRYIHTRISSDDLPYNRSATLNAGAREARGGLLVLHDNDFLIPFHYASALHRVHSEGWEFIDLKRLMFYLSEHDTASLLLRNAIRPVAAEHVVQNLLAGGSVAADRNAYFEIGGFDEAFAGWGGEDNEFWERAATRKAFAFGRMPLVHLWHAPQPEKVHAQKAGVPLYPELSRVPAEERITKLVAAENANRIDRSADQLVTRQRATE
jgi:hypothetical protein